MFKVYPLPRLRVQIPFERSFSEAEFLRLNGGFVADSMDDRWNILFKNPWLHFVRSWTGFCIYKVRLVKCKDGCTVAEVWINRDRRQYRGDDAQQEVQMLSFLIHQLISGPEPLRSARNPGS